MLKFALLLPFSEPSKLGTLQDLRLHSMQGSLMYGTTTVDVEYKLKGEDRTVKLRKIPDKNKLFPAPERSSMVENEEQVV